MKTEGNGETSGLCEGADMYFRNGSCRNVKTEAFFHLKEEYMKVHKELFYRSLSIISHFSSGVKSAISAAQFC